MFRPDPASSGAVLIGTAEYADQLLPPVPSVRNNVTDLAQVLTDPEYWGLPADRCHQVTDPPTQADILEPVVRMAERVTDTLIVYFAGHGLVTADSDFVLATSKTTAKDPTTAGLTYEYLRTVLGRRRALRRVVILDCCYSGRATRALSDPASAVIGQIDAEGTYVLTSAPANSAALVLDGERHTVFTGSLLDIVRSGIPGGTEFVSLDDLYYAALRRLVRDARPRPQRLGSNTAGDLLLLRNRFPVGSRPGGDPVRPRRLTSAPGRRPGPDIADLKMAAAAVAPTLGIAELDSLAVLERAPLVDRQAGSLYEAMTTMREQFGDGAATTAVLVGALIQGLQTALASGAEADTLVAGIDEITDQVRRRLLAGRDRPADDDAARRAVATALPDDESVRMVVRASTGNGRSEVGVKATPGWDTELTTSAKITLESVILSPNEVTRPITLESPYVLISADGRLDPRLALSPSLRTGPLAGEPRVRPLLLITPTLTVVASRALMHGRFAPIVVIRTTDAERVIQAAGGSGAEARRVLVDPRFTTIIGLSRPDGRITIDPENRTTVQVGASRPYAVAHAVRALAIVRSASIAGVTAGGGAGLFWAAQVPAAMSSSAPGDPAGIVARALTEPFRRLVRNAGHTADPLIAQLQARADARFGVDLADGMVRDLTEVGIVDPLAMLAGSMAHATATVSRLF